MQAQRAASPSLVIARPPPIQRCGSEKQQQPCTPHHLGCHPSASPSHQHMWPHHGSEDAIQCGSSQLAQDGMAALGCTGRWQGGVDASTRMPTHQTQKKGRMLSKPLLQQGWGQLGQPSSPKVTMKAALAYQIQGGGGAHLLACKKKGGHCKATFASLPFYREEVGWAERCPPPCGLPTQQKDKPNSHGKGPYIHPHSHQTACQGQSFNPPPAGRGDVWQVSHARFY